MKLKSTSIRRPSIQWLAALSLCFSTAAWADQSWTGLGADALWTTTDNWTTAAPGVGDLAIFDASSAARLATTLGVDFSILGLRLVDPAGAVSIAAGNTLTLGASGIDMSAATQNLSIAAPIILGAAQFWTVDAGRALTVTGVLDASANSLTKSGGGAATLNNTANVTTAGITVAGGTLTGQAAASGNVSLGVGPITLQGGGILTGNPGSNNNTWTSTNTWTIPAEQSGRINTPNRMQMRGAVSGDGTLDFNVTTSVSRMDMQNTWTGFTGQLNFIGSGVVRLGVNPLGSGQPAMNAASWQNCSVDLGGSVGLAPNTNSGGNIIHLGSLSGSSATANLSDKSAGGAATWSIGGLNESTTYAGGIRGVNNVTKVGGGALTLSAVVNLDYSGITTVTLGTLKMNGTKTGAGATNINNGGTLAGTGSIAGTTSINNGGILAPGDAGVGNLTHSSLTLATGSILDLEFVTGNDTVTVATGGTLTLNSGVKLNLYNGAVGEPTLSTNGTYTLFNVTGATVLGLNLSTFEVQNPAAGKLYTFANDGTVLTVTVADAVSDPSNYWNMDGAGSWATPGNWTKGTVPNATEANARIGPGIGGAGAGSPFTLSAFTIDLDAPQTVGDLILNDAASVTIAPGAGGSLSFDNGAALANIVAQAGNHSITAPVAIDAEDAGIEVADTLTLGIEGTISSSVSGGGLTKTGPGTLELTGLNTYNGGTTLAAGILAIDNDASLGATGSSLTFAGGTLRLLAPLADARAYGVLGANNAMIDTNGFGYILSGAIAPTSGGTGGLVKDGAGMLTLAEANTYIGNTTVNAGVLEVVDGGSIDGAALAFGTAGGTLFHVNGGIFKGATTTVPAGITGFRLTSGSATFTGALNAQDNASGAFALINVQGGSLSAASLSVGRSSGAVTVEPAAGATNSGFVVNGAGTIVDIAGNLSVAGSNSTANARMDGGTVTVGGTGTIGLNNTGRWSVLDVNGGVFTLNNTTTGVQLGNGQTGNAIFIVQDGGVAHVGKFTFNAAGAVAYEEIVKVNGGTLYLGAGGMVRTGANDLCVSTVKLQSGILGASADWVSSIDTTLTGAPVIKAADATDAPFNITLSGSIGGTGGLEKTGGGTLTLSGSNTYTGPTTVSAGTLSLGTATLDDAAAVTIASGAKIELTHGATDRVASLTINGTAKPNGTYDNTTDPDFITGTGKILVGPAAGYSSWAALPANGLTAGVNDGPEQDPDYDGIKNLLEYVLGGIPAGAGAANTGILPQQQLDATNLTLTFKRSDLSETDTTVKVQWSTDLTNWTDFVTLGPVDDLPAVDITEDVPSAELDTVVVTIPRAGREANGRLFARVQATK